MYLIQVSCRCLNIFGHVNVQALKKSFQNKTFKHLTHDDIDWTGYYTFQCIDCAQGKSRVHNHIEGARLRYQEKYGPFDFYIEISSVLFLILQLLNFSSLLLMNILPIDGFSH